MGGVAIRSVKIHHLPIDPAVEKTLSELNGIALGVGDVEPIEVPGSDACQFMQGMHVLSGFIECETLYLESLLQSSVHILGERRRAGKPVLPQIEITGQRPVPPGLPIYIVFSNFSIAAISAFTDSIDTAL